MNNFRLVYPNIHLKREIDNYLKVEYERLSKEHDFSLPEKHFFFVVPTVNNVKEYT